MEFTGCEGSERRLRIVQSGKRTGQPRANFFLDHKDPRNSRYVELLVIEYIVDQHGLSI